MYFNQDTALPTFVPLPQFLLTRTLSANAKLLYAMLLARTQLSQRNGWVDEAGSVYVIYTVRQMASALCCSVRSISSALHELEAEGLLTRTRRGWNQANHIYLLLPEDAQDTSAPYSKSCSMDVQESSTPDVQDTSAPYSKSCSMDVQESSTPKVQDSSTPYSKNCSMDVQKTSTPDVQDTSAPYSKNCAMDVQESSNPKVQDSSTPYGKSCSMDVQKTSNHEWQNLPPNKIDRNNRYNQKREEIQARLTYGKYQNVFLCRDELTLLRERYPADYLEAIDDLSCRIVRDGDKYRDHCALLLRSLGRLEEMRSLTSSHLPDPA